MRPSTPERGKPSLEDEPASAALSTPETQTLRLAAKSPLLVSPLRRMLSRFGRPVLLESAVVTRRGFVHTRNRVHCQVLRSFIEASA